MTVRALGAVVFGTSFGTLTHVPALRLAGFEIIGLVGTDAERTARRAGLLEIPHATTSLEEALALPGVDCISVATPPQTHCAIVLAAIAAGKHALCEKPLAANAGEAAAMDEAARAARVVNLVGHELRWLPTLALLEKAVRAGAIGEPRLATLVWLTPGLAGPEADAPDWWTDESRGGGWLGAYGSHAIDHARACLGEIVAVSGGLNVVSQHDWSADDSYTFHFRTDSGAEGVLQSSYGTYGPVASVQRISGTEGTIWVEGNPVAADASVWLATAGGTRALPVSPELVLQPAPPVPVALADDFGTKYGANHATGTTIPAYARLAATFRDLIEGRSVAPIPRPPTFADGLAHMRVLDAVRAAAAGGGWIDVAR